MENLVHLDCLHQKPTSDKLMKHGFVTHRRPGLHPLGRVVAKSRLEPGRVPQKIKDQVALAG